MRLTLSSFVIAMTALLASSGQSCQAARITIIYGTAEHIEKLADWPADVPKPPNFGPATAIGFKYKYSHLYWCGFWTYGGEYVVFDGNAYFPIHKDENPGAKSELDADARFIAEELKIPRSQLNRPFLYAFPLGLLLSGGGIVLLVLVTKFELWPKTYVADDLLKESRYQEAVEIALREREPSEGLRKAAEHLVEAKVSPKAAKQSMATLMSSLNWRNVPTIKNDAEIPRLPAAEVANFLREPLIQKALEIVKCHDSTDGRGRSAGTCLLVSQGLTANAALTVLYNAMNPPPFDPTEPVEPEPIA